MECRGIMGGIGFISLNFWAMISCSNHLTNILTFLILHSLFHESNLPLICNLDESRYYNIFNSSLSSEEEMDFFLNFLAILRGMSELSSLTRNPTQVPWSGSMESQPLDFQGISWDNIFLISIFMFMLSLSRVQLFVTHQAPLTMEFSREEHWSGLPFHPPGDFPDPGIEPMYPALAGWFFTTKPPGKLYLHHTISIKTCCYFLIKDLLRKTKVTKTKV